MLTRSTGPFVAIWGLCRRVLIFRIAMSKGAILVVNAWVTVAGAGTGATDRTESITFLEWRNRRDEMRRRWERHWYRRTDLFLIPGAANEIDDQEEGSFGEIERICATNLHDRQAFPLGNAFLLSRFSGLEGNTQSNSRLAVEHGPHLGGRPSHFW